MSQKTNPISLRLQKTNKNFSLPLFADFFWSETYRTCLENKNYISTFLKETSHSECFFSAKMFYRKFSFFLFLHDNRLTKKEKLLFFKPKGFSKTDQKTSFLSKKSAQTKQSFAIQSKKFLLYENKTASYNTAEKSKINILTASKNRNSNHYKTSFCSKSDPLDTHVYSTNKYRQTLSKQSFESARTVLLTDFLKTKQGFPTTFKFKKKNFLFFNNSNQSLKSSSENNSIYWLGFKIRELDTPHKNTIQFFKSFAVDQILNLNQPNTNFRFIAPLSNVFLRPCLSFCENLTFSLYKEKLSLNGIRLRDQVSSKTKFCNDYSKSIERQFTPSNQRFDPVRFPNKTSFCLKKQNSEKQDLVSKYVNSVNSLFKEKKILQKRLSLISFFPIVRSFEPIRFVNDYQNVMALVDVVISLLEKRITFKQIKSLLFRQFLTNQQIKGIRISCSGRLGGRSKKAQKAKMQSDSYGSTTLATFSSKILFASKNAYTPYGKIGVKIWLSFEDKI